MSPVLITAAICQRLGLKAKAKLTQVWIQNRGTAEDKERPISFFFPWLQFQKQCTIIRYKHSCRSIPLKNSVIKPHKAHRLLQNRHHRQKQIMAIPVASAVYTRDNITIIYFHTNHLYSMFSTTHKTLQGGSRHSQTLNIDTSRDIQRDSDNTDITSAFFIICSFFFFCFSTTNTYFTDTNNE